MALPLPRRGVRRLGGLGESQRLNLRAQAAAVRAFEAEMEAATAATLMRVIAHLGLGVDQVGVHVFLARGLFFRGRWIFGRLVLVGRLRIGARPSMHRPRWSPGKGILGRAWRHGTYVAEDWEAIRLRGEALGREKWVGLPADERYGMSWSELQASAGYRLIAARPVFDLVHQNDRILGCVAVDAQCGLPDSHRELQSILTDLANSVEAVEPPPRAWLNQRRVGLPVLVSSPRGLPAAIGFRVGAAAGQTRVRSATWSAKAAVAVAIMMASCRSPVPR